MKLTKAYWQNFFSYGGVMTTVDFDSFDNICVTGPNGSGKSTILEAIHFALFGKPYRKININSLLNWDNVSSCIVGIVFKNAATEYKIERTLRPDSISIWINGELQKIDVSKAEMQKKINDYVGEDYKVFSQIVLIDSFFYKPFMGLGSAEKRYLVDDIFGMTQITQMLKLAKEYAETNRSKLEQTKKTYELNKEKIKLHESNQIEQREAKIKELEKTKGEDELIVVEENKRYNEENIVRLAIQTFASKLSGKVSASCERSASIKNKIIESESYVNIERRGINSLTENKETICSKCKQPIDSKYHQKELDDRHDRIASEQTIQKDLKVAYDKEKEIEKSLRKRFDHYQQIRQSFVSDLQIRIDYINKVQERINSFTEKLEKLHTDTGDTEGIKILKAEQEDLKNKYNRLRIQKDFITMSMAVLSDGNIKGYILKKYLPLFNTLIQKYLKLLGINLRFSFDGNFEQVVDNLKHNRDFENLSIGQKARVNMAILFSFVEFAETKSKTKFDFMVFDEIIDSCGLDWEGKERVVDIIKNHINKKVVVITHSPEIQDLFQNKINVSIRGLFSKMEFITKQEESHGNIQGH